jgi:hypothetical protein
VDEDDIFYESLAPLIDVFGPNGHSVEEGVPIVISSQRSVKRLRSIEETDHMPATQIYTNIKPVYMQFGIGSKEPVRLLEEEESDEPAIQYGIQGGADTSEYPYDSSEENKAIDNNIDQPAFSTEITNIHLPPRQSRRIAERRGASFLNFATQLVHTLGTSFREHYALAMGLQDNIKESFGDVSGKAPAMFMPKPK